MPIDRERQRLVQEGVEQLRRMVDDPARTNAYDQDNVRCHNLAEVIALLVAEAREAGSDETLLVEILLKASDNDQETLLEARQVLAALGYAEIAALLKRLARNAPQRLTFRERMAARARR